MKKPLLILLCAALICQCATCRKKPAGTPKAPNFVFFAWEVISDPSRNARAQTEIIFSGEITNQCTSGRRSERKFFYTNIAPGNYLIGVRTSLEEANGAFRPLPERLEAGERFILILSNCTTEYEVRYQDNCSRYETRISFITNN